MIEVYVNTEQSSANEHVANVYNLIVYTLLKHIVTVDKDLLKGFMPAADL